MKKLAHTDNLVIVSLTHAEFEGLAKTTADNAVNDQHISLSWIAAILDQVSNFQTFIGQAKSYADNLSTKLGQMIT